MRKKTIQYISILTIITFLSACSTAYKAQPLSFKAPSSYPNAQKIDGITIAAKAYANKDEAQEAFGFDVRGAGMLPVQVIFDNQSIHPLEINASQTFLEDMEGNLWPILSANIAYERATKYIQTKQVFKEGAYGGFLGAVAGAIVGAAIGIVAGTNIAEIAGKGAAVGAAGGAVIGGAQGLEDRSARQAVIDDLKQKSLQAKPVEPKGLAFGFIFFPGEAKLAKQLRLQIVEKDTNITHPLLLAF
ncbi:MAG: hypothetical protein LLF28_07995 [Nitrospiraceae bacterium]|nr:hypothetical protein [Nitrospiraceae bacterium]